jgi:hypothetical protein
MLGDPYPSHASCPALCIRPSLSRLIVGAGVPAIAAAGALDELADGDDGGGEVEVEDDEGGLRSVIRRSLPVAVHSGISAFDGPAFGGLDGGRRCPGGESGRQSPLCQGLAGRLAVMGGVQVAGALIRQHSAELTAGRRDYAGRFRHLGHVLDYLVQYAATMGT